ncbi:peptidyl-prolyl cis-trans isomerase B (cyclophilin B) [Anaeroplasma bactoclasticum]|jgi:peptidyl-prolyl cis-trans isomerase B (cyclophilin B)|uniref:Peptidyl-prolyl cis-trans isomerase n=1 Tax=Anaeroplasma bactoclasticum TaxID=2088 RepID=A0A397RYW7_9MOLU|nr:peptidylprolyl isomerase [Anaeroplasma bactoclasticum]RIA77756.1 peptidyl-prolyl cis-trans isomerase B (cyclophilin B) [Anaeroplasma bactoclasticum]
MKYTKYLNDTNPRVSIDMGNYGVMELELFPSVAPITVENFLKLVEEKFYDGLIFHRVIKDFMIQGGDPTGTGMGGSKEKIKGEFMQNGVKNTLEHTRGVISMARSQNPNSASSQFFICHVNTPHLDGGYAAFGVVVEGLETVDKIANVKTDGRDKPVEDVRIKSITRVR